MIIDQQACFQKHNISVRFNLFVLIYRMLMDANVITHSKVLVPNPLDTFLNDPTKKHTLLWELVYIAGVTDSPLISQIVPSSSQADNITYLTKLLDYFLMDPVFPNEHDYVQMANIGKLLVDAEVITNYIVDFLVMPENQNTVLFHMLIMINRLLMDEQDSNDLDSNSLKKFITNPANRNTVLFELVQIININDIKCCRYY